MAQGLHFSSPFYLIVLMSTDVPPESRWLVSVIGLFAVLLLLEKGVCHGTGPVLTADGLLLFHFSLYLWFAILIAIAVSLYYLGEICRWKYDGSPISPIKNQICLLERFKRTRDICENNRKRNS